MGMFLRHLAGVYSSCLRALVLASPLLLAAPAQAGIWGYAPLTGAENVAFHQSDEDDGVFFRSAEGFHEVGAEGAQGRQLNNAGSATASASPKHTCPAYSPCRKKVNQLMHKASATYDIDYELLHAVIATESGFRIRAVSPKGAVGLMQLIPATAERYGVKDDKYSLASQKLVDPRTNIWVGSRHLNKLIKRYPGDVELALAAYNAGEGAVRRAGNKIPNYPETRKYVKTVMYRYKRLKPPVRPSVSAAGHRAGVKMKPPAKNRVSTRA